MREKPVNLNLFTVAFPVTAVASILHRISGLLLFLMIPLLLNLLNYVKNGYRIELSIMARFLIWLGLSALIYHLFAGVRHLIMDMGFGEDKPIARVTSFIVIISSIVISLFLGYRLW